MPDTRTHDSTSAINDEELQNPVFTVQMDVGTSMGLMTVEQQATDFSNIPALLIDLGNAIQTGNYFLDPTAAGRIRAVRITR